LGFLPVIYQVKTIKKITGISFALGGGGGGGTKITPKQPRGVGRFGEKK
jgi:hypothetical protein